MTVIPKSQPVMDAYFSRRQFVLGTLKVGLSATGAATVLSACHAKGHKAVPARLTGRVQILVGFDGGNTAPQRQVQQALAQAFIAAHPQVGIDFLRATSAAAAETQLTTLIGRGSAPDIVLGIGLAEMSRLVDQRAWLDLRPLVQRDGVSTGAFESQAMTAASLSNYYGNTKAIPGIPVGVHDHALAYNVSLLAKAGVAAPPTSWSDHSWTLSGPFLQAARALTVDAAGRHAGQAGFDSSQTRQFGVARLAPAAVFLGFGGKIYDPHQRRAQFDQPAAISGAQFAGDLVNRYHVQPAPAQLAALAGSPAATGAADPAQSAWRAGKLAMIDMCSCEISSPFGTGVPFAWRAVPLPVGPAGNSGHLEVIQGAIVAASAHHDLAWEVLKYFAVDPSRERQLAFGGFSAMPALTANLSAFTTGTKQAAGVDPAVWTAGRSSSSAARDAWVPAFADIHRLMSDAFNRIAGGEPATTVMPELQLQAQARIDAWFKSHKLP